MTVRATPVEIIVSVWPVPQPVRTIVTLVAQPRHAHLEQSLIDRAVWIMAVVAIIEHRRVLKEERAPSLRVTGVAIFVHAGLLEL